LHELFYVEHLEGGKTVMDKIRPTHKYSGRNSHGFWRYVNALKGKDHDAAYAMGVMLQDLEYRVLKFITRLSHKGK
jgi:hypothetical protein